MAGFSTYVRSVWTQGTKNILLVCLIYLVIFTVYFAPQLRGELLLPGDSFVQYYPLRLYLATAALKDFLWLPHEFLGLPFLGTLQTGLLYPLNLLYLFLPTPFVFGFNIVFHYVLAALFTFFYLRKLELDCLPAFLGGIVFGAFGFLMAHKGHVSMVNAAVWLPLLMLLYEKIRCSLKWNYTAWAGVVVAIQVFAGHYQICIYTYLVMGLFTVYYVTTVKKGKRMKFILLCTMPIIWGSIMALPQLVATQELSRFGLRVGHSYNFFTEYSFPPFMLPTLLFPFIFGTAYGGAYWGLWNTTEMIGFVGILPLVLCIWATIRLGRKNLHVRFFALLALLAFFLALGSYNPFYRLMFFVPVYNIFRVPARHWLEVNLAISMLSAFGLHHLLNGSDLKRKSREVLASLLVVSFLCLFFWEVGKSLFANPFFTFLFNKNAQVLLADAFNWQNPAVFIPMVFMCVYLTWVYLLQRVVNRSYWQKKILVGAGIGFVLAEGFSFGGYHDINYVKFTETKDCVVNSLTTFLKDRAGYERTVSIISDEHLSLFNVPAQIHSLNGYDPMMPASVHELLNMSAAGVSDDWGGLLRNNLILSALNTRYIIFPRQDVYKYRFMENRVGAESGKPINISLGRWHFLNSSETGKGEFTLASPRKDAPSMIYQKLGLLPNTTYLLSLEARSQGDEQSRVKGLHFDLYGGPGYDSSEQELYVDAKKLSQAYGSYYKIIDTGDNIPKWVELRIFSISREAIQVRNIEIKEVNGTPPPQMVNWNPDARKDDPIYREVFDDGGWVVYENLNCLPRAFTVDTLQVASNIREVKRKFDLFEINPYHTALVSPEDLVKIGRADFAKGIAHIEKYETDRVTISTQFQENPGFLVLADQYFPGWKALVDGRSTPIYQTNGLLRGIVVPEGKHTVEFLYRPWKVYIAGMIGIAALAGALFVGFRTNSKIEGL